MRERDTIGPLQRSKALERDDALDGWRRPRRPQGEPVLFWAERAPAFYLRATAISALLMAPMVFFAPGIFLAFLGVLVLSNWLNARLFRFEVGPGPSRCGSPCCCRGSRSRWRRSPRPRRARTRPAAPAC